KPPALRPGAARDREDVRQRGDRRERVDADGRVRQRRMQRMPGKTLDEIPQLHAAVVTAPAAGETPWLLLVRLEEAQEGGVLAQQIFDLRHAGARPVLDPRLGQVIRD